MTTKLEKKIEALTTILNHRVTKLETSVRWIGKIIGYIAILITGITVKFIFGG